MDQYPTVMLKLNPNLYVRLNLKLVRNNSRSDYIYFVRLRVLVDERSLEVYRGEKGQAVMSNVIFQQTSSDGISLATVGEGGGCAVTISGNAAGFTVVEIIATVVEMRRWWLHDYCIPFTGIYAILAHLFYNLLCVVDDLFFSTIV